MPVDFLKIDGSFIRNLTTNTNDQLFVKAISDVAKGMGIKTIAEFVEKEEPLQYLKKYDVDYAQDYFIGKPSQSLYPACFQAEKRKNKKTSQCKDIDFPL